MYFLLLVCNIFSAEVTDELAERIYQYYNEVNQDPAVFRWKFKMKDFSPEENAAKIVNAA